MTSKVEIDLVEDETALPAVGPRLKSARTALDLDVKFIAQRLNIHEKYVLALEQDDYSALPGSAYVKGYIRAYARLVNISGDELIQTYQAWAGESTPSRAVKSINTLDEQVKVSHPLMKVSLYIFVLAILAVSVWWWQTQRSPVPVLEQPITESTSVSSDAQDALLQDPGSVTEPGDEVENTAVTESLPLDETAIRDASDDNLEQSALDADPVAESVDAAPTSEAPASASTTPEAEAVVAPAEAEVTAQSEPEAPVKNTLFIAFVDDCWVSVRDSNQDSLFAGTRHAGETLSLEISASPAYLLIGRASSVSEARFAGKPITMNTSETSDVARVTLR